MQWCKKPKNNLKTAKRGISTKLNTIGNTIFSPVMKNNYSEQVKNDGQTEAQEQTKFR